MRVRVGTSEQDAVAIHAPDDVCWPLSLGDKQPFWSWYERARERRTDWPALDPAKAYARVEEDDALAAWRKRHGEF